MYISVMNYFVSVDSFFCHYFYENHTLFHDCCNLKEIKISITKIIHTCSSVTHFMWIFLLRNSLLICFPCINSTYSNNLIATGNTLVCDWRFDDTEGITMHVLARKHFFHIFY